MNQPSSNATSRQRSGAIDALRVLGIIAVVAGHVWSTKLTQTAFYTWHVPLFFFLTGYLWTTGRSLRTELSKRFNTLGRPYIFWLITIFIFAIVWALFSDGLSVGKILGPIYGGAFATRPFTAFWFITTLFFAALLYRSIERLPNMVRWSIILLGIVSAYLFGDVLARTPLAIGAAWPALLFITAGVELRKMQNTIKAPTVTGIVLLIISIALIYMGFSAPLDMKNGDYGTPILSMLIGCVIPAGLLLIFQRIFDLLPPGFSKTAIWLSSAGFVVVLIHAVPLQIMGTTTQGGFFDFSITLVVPWIIGLLIIQTPLSSWAAGIPKKQNNKKKPKKSPLRNSTKPDISPTHP